MLPCCSLDHLGRQLRSKHFLVYVFLISARVSLVSLVAFTNLAVFLALLRHVFTLLDAVSRLQFLGSGPQHESTVSPWTSVLAAAIAGYSLESPAFSRLPTHLCHHSVRPRLSSLHPHPYSRSRSPLRSCSIPTLVLIPVLVFPPVPTPVPGALFSTRYHIVGQVPGTAPQNAGYLQGPTPGSERQYLVFYSSSFLVWRIPELYSPPLPSLFSFLSPSSITSPLLPPPPFASPSPLLLSFSSPLPSPFLSCIRPLVFNPVPAPFPLRPRYRLACFRFPPPLFPFPLGPVPIITVHVSVSAPDLVPFSVRCVCVCIDNIAHHRAICSCPTSHSLPLVLALSRGDTLYALRIPLISDATKGAHSLYAPFSSLSVSLLFSRYPGSVCAYPPP